MYNDHNYICIHLLSKFIGRGKIFKPAIDLIGVDCHAAKILQYEK